MALVDRLQRLRWMEFEWDEKKRVLVLEKHGVDFDDVAAIFSGLHLISAAKSDFEIREIAIGFVGNKLVAVVFTRRGESLRLITARRARENERRAYRAVYS
jgi:uncharacterized protein